MSESLDDLLGRLVASEAKTPNQAPVAPRERIVKAALALFAERSFEGVTTKAIAEHAHVTERTLFKHFQSKDQLFASAVFPLLFQVLAPLALEPFLQLLEADSDDFAATLRALVAERIAMAERHPALLPMALRELLLRPAFRELVATAFNERTRPQLELIIGRARAHGQIRTLPTEVVMRAIGAQLATYLITRQVLAPNRPWDDAGDAEEIVTLILRGIGAQANNRADAE